MNQTILSTLALSSLLAACGPTTASNNPTDGDGGGGGRPLSSVTSSGTGGSRGSTCAPGLGLPTPADAPVEASLHDVAATPDSILVTMGGDVLRSLDRGTTWSVVPLSRLRDIEGDSEGYAALDIDGSVLLGQADASSFSEVTAGLPPQAKVDAIARGGGVTAVLADGQAYRWDRLQQSFVALPLPSSATPWQRLATDGEHWLAATEATLLQSEDGVTWTEVSQAGAWGFFDLAIDGDHRVAATFTGMMRSVDGGLTWALEEDSISTIGVVDEVFVFGDITLAGHNGVFVSEDQGTSWSTVPGTVGFAGRGAAWDGDRILVGSGLLRRRNEDGSWSAVTSLRSRHLQRLHAVGGELIATTQDNRSHHLAEGWSRLDGLDRVVATAQHGSSLYAISRGAYYTDLVASTDGGRSWTPTSIVGGTGVARMGSIASVDEALLVGSTTVLGGGSKTGSIQPGIGIHRTLDGGTTWLSANDGLPRLGHHDADTSQHPYVQSLFAVGDSAYTVLEGAGLFRSMDAGASWQLLDEQLSGYDLVATRHDAALLAKRSEAGTLLRLTAAGIEAVAASGLPAGVVADVEVLDELFIVTVVGEPGVFASADGGATFFAAPGDLGDARALAAVDDTLWVAIEGQGLVKLNPACR